MNPKNVALEAMCIRLGLLRSGGDEIIPRFGTSAKYEASSVILHCFLEGKGVEVLQMVAAIMKRTFRVI